MFQAPSSSCRVQVLHAYPLISRAVESVVQAMAGFSVVTERQLREGHRPADIVIGDEATALLSVGGRSRSKAVALSDAAREVDVRRALAAGVSGYLVLSDGLDEIASCLRVVSTGGRHICEAAAKCLADAYGRDELTRREQEVLDLLGEGLCNKRIARRMAIAEGTVKTHVKSVLGKLEARTRAHAVSVALQRGLLSGAAHPLRQTDFNGLFR